jgi:hypothetical protein
MGYLIELALGIGGNLIAAEMIFRHKRWCQRIIRSAAKRIGDPQQCEIKLEEWLAALDEHVGVLASFAHAIGCWVGAPAVATALKQPVAKKASGGSRKTLVRIMGTSLEIEVNDLTAQIVVIMKTDFEQAFKSAASWSEGTSDRIAKELGERPILLVGWLVASLSGLVASIIWLIKSL